MNGLFCLLSIGVAAAAGLTARWWFSLPGDAIDPRSVGLHEYEIAYLAGGEPRAVGGAIASLALRGLVAVDGATKTIRAVGEIPGMAHPLERAVHAAAGVGARIDAVRDACKVSTSPLRERLESLGLVVSPDARIGLQGVAGGVYAATLVLLWVIDGGRGVGSFTFMAGLFVGIVLLISPPFRTRRGNSALHRLVQDSSALKETAYLGAGVLSPTDMSLAVGLFGASILAGGPLSELPQALDRERGSCGSCGGGSCGGCGGCGGCGCGGCA